MKPLIAALMISAVSIPVMAAGGPSDAQIDAAFKKADPDNDGTVSWAEASRFGITKGSFMHANRDKDATLAKKEFVEALKYQFSRANSDKDGTLDRKEAAKAGIGKRVFDSSNRDKDDTLDFGEYVDALTAKAK
jgi:Ca2+-binding EF-hand superfamily protein